jgi:hypothetical protein
MSNRLLVMGLLCVGAVGQMACSSEAEATEGSMSLEADSSKKDFAPPAGQFCGGFAAIQCPSGLVCVDDPNDNCDPNNGGSDCGGVCVAPGHDATVKCDQRDPQMSYVSQDPNKCAAITFRCEEGFTQFYDDCGCGCEPATAP